MRDLQSVQATLAFDLASPHGERWTSGYVAGHDHASREASIHRADLGSAYHEQNADRVLSHYKEGMLRSYVNGLEGLARPRGLPASP